MLTAKRLLMLAAMLAVPSGIAKACPYCRLGSASLVGTYEEPGTTSSEAAGSSSSATTRPASSAMGDNSPRATADDSKASRLPFGLSAAGGADMTTAYYHRGYLMGDHGAIAQPYLTLFRPVVEQTHLTVMPYVGVWTDFQEDGTRNSGSRNGTATSGVGTASMFCCASSATSSKSSGTSPWITPAQVPVPPGGSGLLLPGGGGATSTTTAGSSTAAAPNSNPGFNAYEADITGGVAVNAGPFFLDVKYTAYTYPNGALSGYEEVGAKLSVDLAPLLLPHHEPEPFLLRPFAEVDRETGGLNRGDFTYIETGLEPSFDVPIGRTEIGITLPVTFGLNGDRFYTNANGTNDPLGYMSVGMKFSVPLPVPARMGEWYLSASVMYLHLDAYNLLVLNGDRRDAVIGSVGIGFHL